MKIIYLLSLLFISIISLLLVLPTINNNIEDPNLIIYFNADEGGFMDLIWLYFSGEKRPSFQWDFDYGLEMVYLSDLSTFILSKFINLTPGRFVLMLRWIHLSAWILSFFTLWRLISYHFGRKWQALLAVVLLASRPAFVYFSVNLKPEPLVLLFIIIGLDYALRLVEKPKKRYLFISAACAALAFTAKYSGIFLLPAIVASMYFGELYQHNTGSNTFIFPRFKASWIFPALLGFAFMVLPLTIIFFYIRKSTGTTWYEEHGIWTSLLQNKTGLYSFFVGIFFILSSVVIFTLNKSINPFLKKTMQYCKSINSYSLIVIGIFVGFVFLFGIRWLISPKYFISAYAFLGSAASAEPLKILANEGFLRAFLYKLIERIKQLDLIIFLLFMFYVSLEIYFSRKGTRDKSLQMFKRLVLLIFVLPVLILICSMLRIAQHHMLPFFVAISILATEAFYISGMALTGRSVFKNLILGLIISLFLANIYMNGIFVIKSRIHQFRQKEDIAYEIGQWWRKNISEDAEIVAAHYIDAYIPAGYKNVRTLNWNEKKHAEALARLVNIYHPQFIYYNAGSGEEDPLSYIEGMPQGIRIKLVKSFDAKGRRYQRRPQDRFVVYKVSY